MTTRDGYGFEIEEGEREDEEGEEGKWGVASFITFSSHTRTPHPTP